MPAFLIPAIIGAVGAGASFLRQRAANKSVEEQQRLYNQWLKERQKGAQDIVTRLQESGFDPFGAQTTRQAGTSFSATDTDSTTVSRERPQITPEYQAMESLWRGILQERLARPSSLPIGTIERAVSGINLAAAPGIQRSRNLAASRGVPVDTLLLGSPVESARIGKIQDLIANIPLKERELQNEDVSLASRLAQVFGLGREGTSTTRGRSTTRGTTSGTVSSPPNITALANLLLPPGPQQGGGSGQSAGAGLLGDAASLAASLYSMGLFGGGRSRPFDDSYVSPTP